MDGNKIGVPADNGKLSEPRLSEPLIHEFFETLFIVNADRYEYLAYFYRIFTDGIDLLLRSGGHACTPVGCGKVQKGAHDLSCA